MRSSWSAHGRGSSGAGLPSTSVLVLLESETPRAGWLMPSRLSRRHGRALSPDSPTVQPGAAAHGVVVRSTPSPSGRQIVATLDEAGGRSLRSDRVQSVVSGRGPAVIVPARERLAALLGDLTAPGSFSAQRTAPVDDLHLEVRGVGPLALPVPEAQAKLLCHLGRPARYGRGEVTLLDPQVRDTWEIPRSRVKIDKRRWNKTLLPMLARLRGDLGLPESCRARCRAALAAGVRTRAVLRAAPGLREG